MPTIRLFLDAKPESRLAYRTLLVNEANLS